MHPETVARQLGERLRQERESQGLRQDQVALAAGVSVRAVHQVESGKPTSRLDVLARIARALGLALEIRAAPRGHVRAGDIEEG